VNKRCKRARPESHRCQPRVERFEERTLLDAGFSSVVMAPGLAMHAEVATLPSTAGNNGIGKYVSSLTPQINGHSADANGNTLPMLIHQLGRGNGSGHESGPGETPGAGKPPPVVLPPGPVSVPGAGGSPTTLPTSSAPDGAPVASNPSEEANTSGQLAGSTARAVGQTFLPAGDAIVSPDFLAVSPNQAGAFLATTPSNRLALDMGAFLAGRTAEVLNGASVAAAVGSTLPGGADAAGRLSQQAGVAESRLNPGPLFANTGAFLAGTECDSVVRN